MTISSARDDSGLWGYVLRGGKALLYPDLAGRSARNDYLSLPRFWCRMILRRYLRSLGDCGRYLKVQPRTFGCFSVRITSPTCPHRPGSSPFDEMVENGAGRRIAQFGRFSWFCSEPSKMSDAPTGTILDHFVEWGRSRAVWTCRRCDTHAKLFTSARFLRLNLERLLETAGRSPEVD